jgi:hypothetical protein
VNRFNHNGGDDEDDLKILEEYCKVRNIKRLF